MLKKYKTFISKYIFLSLLLSYSLLIANDLTVTVTKIQGDKGDILIGVYNRDDGSFADISKYYKKVAVKIDGKRVSTTFKGLPNGVYAVAVIHDENQNKKIDKNFLGIPTEGYGFSNNHRFMMRGATFKESQFKLDKDKEIVVEMGY